jgi:glycosyltransferase involved in cell wall biosynthesis
MQARADAGPTRVVRIIARLNIGGPAIQAITLTDRLAALGFHTTLVRGMEDPSEGNMDHLARALGVSPVRVPWLRRNPSWRDIPALLELIRIIRRERPHIVHTHAAKAGALGRAAALIALAGHRPKPVLLHTYHGHSLTGYFPARTAAVFRRIEQTLAPRTDRLIAVSSEVRDELVAMEVAPASKFSVVPLGFDLAPFMIDAPARRRLRGILRTELQIDPRAVVVTLIARLVPIKRVDRFLRAACALRDLEGVHFVIVGDGELGEQLRTSPEARALAGRLTWTGFRNDIPAICFASDLVTLTSDNEGTPVSLIEAQAAGVPVVSTDVGGTASVVRHGETGYVVPRDDEQGFGAAVKLLCCDPAARARMGDAGQVRSATYFSLDRLVDDMVRLYRNSVLAEN